ncbi:hypothetical protein OCK74_00825 [Chitinophagaceae bacterium LB-8]|jgi:hypothetical protein|uniref:Uncharacterized protein n=1 Tax=Paraflavisolibacter caeni TaxID=2982496 RepID=A0A9X3BET7_9BACT|nr:hypothetical protein [Paraflavisolibacter caeni]MCU7547629.1 hypothetical protein [Paraflavisolibacter caeni]
MKTSTAFAGGLAGACALTVVHELVRKADSQAPRQDKLGMQVLAKTLHKANKPVPSQKQLRNWALAGDIVLNSLYYSLAGAGKPKNVFLRGVILGAASGLGTLFLPKYMGLDNSYSNRSSKTKVLSVALYVIGGLAAAAAIKALTKSDKEDQKEREQRTDEYMGYETTAPLDGYW